MKDHVTPAARLALHRHVVCIAAPDWAMEILCTLVLLLGIALLCAIGKLAMLNADMIDARAEVIQTQGEVAFWRELALAPDTVPTVRVERDGLGFTCARFNVRREWEAAVDAECQRMGGLLLQARAEH